MDLVRRNLTPILALLVATTPALAGSASVIAPRGMVICEDSAAAEAGIQALKDGGSAVDAAVATAFALAVTFPAAGNIGGGGFMVYKPADADPEAYDFRETAPAGASPTMWLVDGQYDARRHHYSHLAVGVPGTVAGLHMAWKDHGKLPWKRLVAPAIHLAENGFVVSEGLARSLRKILPQFSESHPATMEQFTNDGSVASCRRLARQRDLARTLTRIAEAGPAGFYQGETANLIEQEMKRHGGILTTGDLRDYRATKRFFRPAQVPFIVAHDLLMPPPGIRWVSRKKIVMLNVLEGYDITKDADSGAARNIHLCAEAMRRLLDRARHLGDPEFNLTCWLLI